MTRTLTAALAMVGTVVLAVSGCASAESDDTLAALFDGTHVSAAQFQDALEQPGVVIIDVRTPEEFAEGHLPAAVNIDVSATDFADRVSQLDRAVPYAVYCRTANRSQVALDVMDSQGFVSVVGMAGGIVAWPGSIVRP